MDKHLTRIVAWLAVLISLPVLKMGSAFFLPVGLALVFFHPMLPWYLRLLPSQNDGKHNLRATAAVSMALVLILTLLIGGISAAGWYGLQENPDLPQQIRQQYEAQVGPDRVSGTLSKAQSVASELFPILPGIALFFFLAWEYPPLRSQVEKRFGNGDLEQAIGEFENDGRQLQRFWLARTVAGLLTGASVGLVLWLLGVPLAWLWGMLNFLLNYIPTVGSFIGVVIPVGFAMVSDTGSSVLFVALAVGGIQIIYGVFVDPLIQDRFLPMSSLMIFLAILFWGWMWGPWGALIGVPMTYTLARFSSYHPIYRKFGQIVLQSEDED